jgi:N-acetylmuramoyl-L-alanine amidase
LPLENTPIERVRSGVRAGSDLRLVFDLTADIDPKSFVLAPNERTGHRLVIDLFDQESDEEEATEAPVKSVEQLDTRRKVMVAIDAGHGGEDPGASGPNKLREKTVVLEIAKRLHAKLSAAEVFDAVLIRTGDYYITHKGRRDLARENQADLFVSIHADAFTHPSANGASVYALSTSGASSTAAQFLADKENAADLVGGVAVAEMDDMLAGVLTDLSMTATLDSSLSVGAEVLEEMGAVAPRLHKKQVEQAAFLVLKSPDIPSILIETGFISNPREAGLLATASYQEKMASAIFQGIERWFTDHPPPGTLLARRDENTPEMTIEVRRGDTLSELARRYSTSVRALKERNRLSGNAIQVGQVLIIPESG